MAGRHGIRGAADDESEFLMNQMLESLISARIRDDKRRDGGKQHDACRLRRRMSELENLFVSRLMTANLVDENRRFGVALLARSGHAHTPPEIDAHADVGGNCPFYDASATAFETAELANATIDERHLECAFSCTLKLLLYPRHSVFLLKPRETPSEQHASAQKRRPDISRP